MSRRKGLTREMRDEMRAIDRELAAMGPAPEPEDPTCLECGGLYQCSPSAPEHSYYTAADAKRPAVTVSPRWRDPLIHNTTKNDDENGADE